MNILTKEHAPQYRRDGITSGLLVAESTRNARYLTTSLVEMSPELNRSFVYLDCGAMQRLFSAEHRLTCAVIEPVQSKLTAATAEMLRNTLDPEAFEVLTWRQMLPELVQ
ncbi:MAG: hypothetical protein JW863_02695 [Chitinispirillaceae bacterium]|nr:hypothetical protein [Chitinispirillaceae bacterium]